MARPKSDEKKHAILAAAVRILAQRGVAAPTAAISSAAGVAEGTLFTYFATKDDLINAVYRDLKLGLADAMMAGYPRKKRVRERLAHVWRHYVDWGVAHPQEQAALKVIEAWPGLTAASKEAGARPFAEVQQLAADAAAQRLLRDVPAPFAGASLGALAEMTMQLIRDDPQQADAYRQAGFDMLWAGLARRR